MIKIENTILPSAEQMEFVIEGMRNPKNSWEKSDSKKDELVEVEKEEDTSEKINNDDATMNDSDIERNDVDDFANDLFSNLDNTETYTTYYVYIVKEEDTIDKIISLYGVTKEDIENYNDITSIKPGDKVIIPKTSE